MEWTGTGQQERGNGPGMDSNTDGMDREWTAREMEDGLYREWTGNVQGDAEYVTYDAASMPVSRDIRGDNVMPVAGCSSQAHECMHACSM